MIFEVQIGNIKPEALETWKSNKDCYKIIDNPITINSGDWMYFIQTADELFGDSVQLDWGSYAWQAKKEDILYLLKDSRMNAEGLDKLEDGRVYGVVFIEIA